MERQCYILELVAPAPLSNTVRNVELMFPPGGVNVAEALVSKGLASCVRYSADNDQRSSKYDDLLAAEDKAQKSNKGKNVECYLY